MRPWGALLTLTLLTLSTARAYADDAEKQACVTSYTEGQRARKAGHLRAARSHFVLCAQQTCPLVISNDCGGWLSELDASLPTVVLRVRDETGVDRTDVSVLVDGEPLAADASGLAAGLALPMDPGPHHLRFERNQATAEVDVVLREGEKLRPIEVALVLPTPPTAPKTLPQAPTSDASPASPSDVPPVLNPVSPPLAPTASEPTPPPLAPTASEPPSPVLTYVAFGVAAAAVGTSAILGIGAKADLDDLRSTCAPHCDQADVDAVHDRMLVADLTLSVGIAAAIVGSYLWLSEPSSPQKPSNALRFRPSGVAFLLELP